MLLGSGHSAAALWAARKQQGQQQHLAAGAALAGRAALVPAVEAGVYTDADTDGDVWELLTAVDPELATADSTAGAAQHGAWQAAAGASAQLSSPVHAATGKPGLGSGGSASAACIVPSSAATVAASWTVLAKAHLLAVEVACSSELFLTAFYWALLYSGEDRLWWNRC